MKGEARESRSFWVPLITFFLMWKGTKEHDEEVKVLRFWSEDEKRERRHDASRSARLHAPADMKARIARARCVLYLAAQQNTRRGEEMGFGGWKRKFSVKHSWRMTAD